MRIVCPSCAAEYDVPASRLTPGRAARCARCNAKWLPVREAEQLEPDLSHPPQQVPEAEATVPLSGGAPTVMPQLTAMDRLAAAGVQPRRAPGLAAAWVMTGLVLVAAVAATLTWRDQLVSMWPPANRILGSLSPAAAPVASPRQAAHEAAAHDPPPVQPTGQEPVAPGTSAQSAAPVHAAKE